MTTLLTLSLLAQPVPPPAWEFDTIILADAKQIDGRTVRIEFSPGKPSYTWPGPLRTFTGPAERDDDDQERTVVLKGDRVADLKDGKRYRCVGVLRVIEHQATVVNGVVIPKWIEIRFEVQ